jgi:hypothetical protein
MRTVGFSVPGAELYPGFTRRAYAARIARESNGVMNAHSPATEEPHVQPASICGLILWGILLPRAMAEPQPVAASFTIVRARKWRRRGLTTQWLALSRVLT